MDFPYSSFVYPVSPLPNTRYFASDTRFMVALAVDNHLAATDGSGFTLLYELTTPDKLHSSGSRTYEDGPFAELSDPDVGIYVLPEILPPGLYGLTWQFSWTHCYWAEREVSRGGKSKGKKIERFIQCQPMTVESSFDFMIDLYNGTEIPSASSLAEPDRYGPGALAMEVIDGIDENNDGEYFKVANPKDWYNQPATITRPADPLRTVPGAVVSPRSTVVPNYNPVITSDGRVSRCCPRALLIFVSLLVFSFMGA